MALTRSQLMRLAQNAEYWREREARQREAYIRTEDEELAEINRIYNEMYRWAEREISAFYGRYADAEGIDITEAKKRVSQLDIKKYEELAKQYVKDKDFSDRANAEMRLYNATMRINRLELLKAQIGLKLVDGINDVEKHWEKIATERATQEIIRQSGILGKTLTDTETARTAEQIVNADFYNANFSERIWSHMDNLRSEISIELQKGFIAGIGSRQMATNLRKVFDVSVRDAHRLARTELRRIQTDVAKDNYERQGIEEYEYMAVNPNACPICKDLDGKVFKVSEMQAGLNAPPIHPNCHCTTAPKVNETEYEQWLTWLEQGGTTAQWDTMTDAQRQSWYDRITSNLQKEEQPTIAEDEQPVPSEEKTPAPKVSEEEQVAQDMTDALGEAYEYHRKKNGLNATPYADIKDSDAITVDLDGLDAETAKAFTGTLTKLVNEYDTTLQTIRVQTLKGLEDVFASTYHDYTVDKSTMVINPLKCGNNGALMERLTDCRSKGWLVNTDMLERYVATHEFAHTLVDTGTKLNSKTNWLNADYRKVEAVRREINSIYSEYLDEIAYLEKQAKEYADIANEDFDFEMAKKSIELEKQANELKISEYSMENADEFMAEAFTYAKIGNGTNEYADRVLEVIDRYYKKVE